MASDPVWARQMGVGGSCRVDAGVEFQREGRYPALVEIDVQEQELLRRGALAGRGLQIRSRTEAPAFARDYHATHFAAAPIDLVQRFHQPADHFRRDRVLAIAVL